MTRRPRRKHSPAFKAKVAIAALKGVKTLAELSQQFDFHKNQIIDWKSQLLNNAAEAFGGSGTAEPEFDVKVLHAKMAKGFVYLCAMANLKSSIPTRAVN